MQMHAPSSGSGDGSGERPVAVKLGWREAAAKATRLQEVTRRLKELEKNLDA